MVNCSHQDTATYHFALTLLLTPKFILFNLAVCWFIVVESRNAPITSSHFSKFSIIIKEQNERTDYQYTVYLY